MIRLRIEGLMLERLLERALSTGATFSAVRREGRALIVDTDAGGERALAELCERFSIRHEVIARRGIDALIPFMRRRWTLLPAAFLCAALLFWYTQRVWMIEVSFEGERPMPVECAEVLEMLGALGVSPGMRSAALDPELLALELSARSEEFSFVGARVRGVRLVVELAPSLPSPEVYDINRARDLVASADGIVLSVNARAGVAAVKPGDIVRRGDVLIRGEERVTKEVTRGIAALGEVIARTWAVGEAEANTHALERTFTGREATASKLALLDWSIPLVEAESLSPSEDTVEHLPVGGLFLPLMIERTTEREYREHAVPLDEAALRQQLADQAFALAEGEIEEYDSQTLQIVDKWIDYSMIEEGRLRARAIVEVHRDIASTREALLQGG